MKETKDGYYVATGLKHSIDFKCLDDKYFQFDFEEEIESIPVELKIEYKDLKKEKKDINICLVEVKHIPKTSSRSLGKYRCKYERF